MPMGLVKDSDFQAELENTKITPPVTSPKKDEVITGEVIDYSKGRGNGNVGVPNTLRQIIGETGAIEGRQEAVDLARQFGIGSSSVSAYTNGSTSTASYDKTPNKNFINRRKERITKKAIRKLGLALDCLDESNLSETKPRDLAGIAKDMSAIVKNMEPEQEKIDPSKNGPTFIFYSPQVKNESNFEVVYAKE
jgi:hypothetical protein